MPKHIILSSAKYMLDSYNDSSVWSVFTAVFKYLFIKVYYYSSSENIEF